MIVIHKTERNMVLIRQGKIIGHYTISLGQNADHGRKQREGDKKTPEGNYIIDSRNPHSRFYLSLHISYPDRNDLQRGQTEGYLPGENIMVHGSPNGWKWLSPVLQLVDWTDGCIAVSNADMKDIWAKVPTGTRVEIMP